MHALKITEELCLMTLKNGERFERELTCEVKRIAKQFVLKATMVFPIPTRQSRQRNVNT